MEKETKNILNKLKKIFKTKKEVSFCYLFGSFAYENFNSESDVDIAVFLKKDDDEYFFKKRILLIEELEGFLNKSVEVVILNEIESILFKFAIIKEGKVILERDHEVRVDFEFKTMKEYYDFKPFLDKYNKAYIKRELSKTN